MKQFKSVINEINQTLNSIYLFGIFLNSILLFLAIYLVLLLIGYPGVYALYPAVVFLIAFSIIKFRENKIRKVEANYRYLNERLRTAADNLHVENPVVHDLQAEIVNEIRAVEVSSFLNTRNISLKILTSIVICFLLLYMTSADIKPIQIDSMIKGVNDMLSSGKGKNQTANVFAGGPIGAGEIAAEGEIFGIPSWIKLGQREENIVIGASGYEVNVRDIKEAEKQNFEEQFPEEVFIQGASAYEENIPKEQQELVKNYFKKLAGS